MQYVVLIAAILSVGACLVSPASSAPAKDRLTRDLLANYQPSVDPGNIELSFGLAVICSRLDFNGSVVSNVWEQHFWQDPRLSWDPSEYGGVDKIRVPAKSIWTPDTRVYSSVTSFVERDDVNAVITSDGSVTWIPTATYRTFCQASGDGSSCQFRIGSWTYDGINVALKTHGSDPLDMTYYNSACPGVITSHTAAVVSHTYPCCPEPYPSLDVSFTVKPRRA